MSGQGACLRSLNSDLSNFSLPGTAAPWDASLCTEKVISSEPAICFNCEICDCFAISQPWPSRHGLRWATGVESHQASVHCTKVCPVHMWTHDCDLTRYARMGSIALCTQANSFGSSHLWRILATNQLTSHTKLFGQPWPIWKLYTMQLLVSRLINYWLGSQDHHGPEGAVPLPRRIT